MYRVATVGVIEGCCASCAFQSQPKWRERSIRACRIIAIVVAGAQCQLGRDCNGAMILFISSSSFIGHNDIVSSFSSNRYRPSPHRSAIQQHVQGSLFVKETIPHPSPQDRFRRRQCKACHHRTSQDAYLIRSGAGSSRHRYGFDSPRGASKERRTWKTTSCHAVPARECLPWFLSSIGSSSSRGVEISVMMGGTSSLWMGVWALFGMIGRFCWVV